MQRTLLTEPIKTSYQHPLTHRINPSSNAAIISLTLLPIGLAMPPFDLPAGIVGLCFLPSGVAMLLGAAAGNHYPTITPDTPTASIIIPYHDPLIPP